TTGRFSPCSTRPRKAIQYLVGNPLIALQMTRRNLGAGLYAPLRVLIYEEDGKTFVEYDKASSLFGQFKDPHIDAVASTLDQKLEARVTAAIKRTKGIEINQNLE